MLLVNFQQVDWLIRVMDTYDSQGLYPARGELQKIDARTRLLGTLSDGNPDDYDGYRGDYGIEDTRKALIEAKNGGVQPFCITIDSEARDYLPHMYGAINYVLVDDIRTLPLKVSDIYRRLTA